MVATFPENLATAQVDKPQNCDCCQLSLLLIVQTKDLGFPPSHRLNQLQLSRAITRSSTGQLSED